MYTDKPTRPWVNDPEYKKLTKAQQIYVDAVLSSVHAIYQGGRQIGKTVMYEFIKKWLDKLENKSP